MALARAGWRLRQEVRLVSLMLRFLLSLRWDAGDLGGSPYVFVLLYSCGVYVSFIPPQALYALFVWVGAGAVARRHVWECCNFVCLQDS